MLLVSWLLKRYNLILGRIDLTIEGYTEPLNEGDDLTLTCKLIPPDAELDDPISITFTQDDSSDETTVVVGRTYAKRNITTADAGEYRCEAGQLRDSVIVVITAAQDSGNLAAQSQTDVATLAPIIGISLAAFIAFMAITVYLLYKRRYSSIYADSSGRY